MTNTRTPVLYKAQPHHGVVALLTEAAYLAYRESWHRKLAFGTWEQAAEAHPELMNELEARVAAGTFTFVETDRYYEGHPMYRVVHTGGTDLLTVIQRLCEVALFNEDVPFGVPFSSGDFDSYEEFLDQGYGPHAKELGEILRQAIEAQVHGAWRQIATEYPSLLKLA